MSKMKTAQKPCVMSTLADILAYKFVGNHAGDHKAFDQVYDFVMTPGRDVAEAASALRHMYAEGMGLEGKAAGVGVPDAKLVKAYVEEY